MNRNLRQPDSSGSLDLMLDILCNVFGSVILIACLIAILPRHPDFPTPWPLTNAENQILERRTETVEGEIDKMLLEISRLEDSVDPLIAGLISRRNSLQGTLDKLAEEVDELSVNEETMAEASALVALGKKDDLEERLKRMRQELVRIESMDLAGAEKIEFLEGRLKTLQGKVAKMDQARVLPVRFPKEKGDAGNVFPIIVRYGKIYPLLVGEDLGLNPSIKNTVASATGVYKDPVRGGGQQLPEDERFVSVTLRAAKKQGCYIAAYVYDDSHGAFQDLKALILAAKLQYGLEFVPGEKRLAFSTEGTSPPKL